MCCVWLSFPEALTLATSATTPSSLVKIKITSLQNPQAMDWYYGIAVSGGFAIAMQLTWNQSDSIVPKTYERFRRVSLYLSGLLRSSRLYA